MKKRFAFILSVFLLTSMLAVAQEDENELRNLIGVNVFHTVFFAAVSSSFEGVFNLPIHLHYVRALNKDFGIASFVFYRRDSDAYSNMDEIGFAVGPHYSGDYFNGFFVNGKCGLGYTFGRDYYNEAYSRVDLVIEPDVGYNFLFGRNYAFTVGIGMQTLIPLVEIPSRAGRWDWTILAQMSHYYLPVGNVTFALLF